MKNILALAKDRQIAAEKKGVLKEPECSNYYKVLKTTPEQLSRTEVKNLNLKCWQTLDYLMRSLNLPKEFDILFDAHTNRVAK
jgi:hypothetical protein